MRKQTFLNVNLVSMFQNVNFNGVIVALLDFSGVNVAGGGAFLINTKVKVLIEKIKCFSLLIP